MHVQLDPVVIYGVLKKVSDFLRRGAPKIPRPCVFLPWFLIRSDLCRSIPLACWDSMGASTWGGGHGNVDQGRGVFSPSHLFPHRSKIYFICFKWRCWFESFFVWRLLLEIWASSAHHQMIFSAIRSTCAEISWGYCWLESHVSYPHHFFYVVVSWGNGEGLFELAFGVDLFHLHRQIIREFLIGWSAVLLFKQEGKEILHHLYLFLQFYYPNVVVINTYSVYATLLIYSLLKASVLIYSVIKQNPILLGTI